MHEWYCVMQNAFKSKLYITTQSDGFIYFAEIENNIE